jgi:Tfp pilus assembly protein FimV
MTRSPGDRPSERAAITAAADRLLAGAPLRSSSGRLTASELIIEAGLRRDVVYGDHKDLVEGFQARVRAQHATPAAMQQLAEQHAELQRQLGTVRAELAAEQQAGATLRRMVAELSLELHQAREELSAHANATPLRRTRGPATIGPGGQSPHQ